MQTSLSVRICACALVATSLTHAAVISGGGPDIAAPLNNTPPQAADPWQRVFAVDGLNSAVYLGGGWGLTTRHVGVTAGDAFEYAGTTYVIQQTVPHPDANLELFEIDLDPAGILSGLPVITVTAGAPTVGTVGLHIGTGKIQTSQFEQSYGLETGYPWSLDGDNDKRWNMQPVSTEHFVMSNSQGDTVSFATAFVRDYGFGALTENDQGSPFFLEETNGDWTLAGVGYGYKARGLGGMDQMSVYESNASYFVNSGHYRGWLEEVTGLELTPVPEPGSLGLLLLAVLSVLRRRQ